MTYLGSNEGRMMAILEEMNDSLKDLCRNLDRIANALEGTARSDQEPPDDQPPLPPSMRWSSS